MATASLLSVTTELRRRRGYIPSGGIDNCRPKYKDGVPRPDLGWSEHAYGNAEDLQIYGYAAQKPYVDELVKMRGEGYPVGWIGWAGNRPSDHTDHIHVQGSPNHDGQTPPCAGGESTRASAGRTRTTTSDSVYDTASGGVNLSRRDGDAFDLTILGVDFGKPLYRAMWLFIAMGATALAVNLIGKGFVKSAVTGVAKGVTKGAKGYVNAVKNV